MGVNPTPSNFKTFTFDNTNSAQYGVYITGEGVFNAPERNVELIDIPGRNGAYALDKGNFNNIEVTYPAGIVADTEADFAKAVSDLRNFLCSKSGYCRLTDDYNSGEYRMAIYKSGLEVSHEGLLTGEFDITFECKPQRYLTSGETKQTLTSGNAITNPTLFPSKPQLQVYGYGDIDIGGQAISVLSGTTVGTIQVYNHTTWSNILTKTIEFDDSCAVTGDLITLNSKGYSTVLRTLVQYVGFDNSDITDITTTASNNDIFCVWGGGGYETFVAVKPTTCQYGTPLTKSGTYTVDITTTNYGVQTIAIGLSFYYHGTNEITLTATISLPSNIQVPSTSLSLTDIMLDSTLQSLGIPLYIDLDIGEAYKIENGSAVSVNNAVSLPAELPTLPSGATTITFDNTFTKVDIVPRWWKV